MEDVIFILPDVVMLGLSFLELLWPSGCQAEAEATTTSISGETKNLGPWWPNGPA